MPFLSSHPDMTYLKKAGPNSSFSSKIFGPNLSFPEEGITVFLVEIIARQYQLRYENIT